MIRAIVMAKNNGRQKYRIAARTKGARGYQATGLRQRKVRRITADWTFLHMVQIIT